MNEENDNLSLYSIAGQSRSLLFIYLIEKNKNGFFLYRIDTLDRAIISETWHASREEAVGEAVSGVPGQFLEWKVLPKTVIDTVQYIFDHEPRLTAIPLAKVQTDVIPFAIKLIWLDLVVTSLISIFDSFSTGPGPASPIAEMMSTEIVSPWTMILFLIGVNLIVTLFIVFKISEGAKWGRNTYAFSCLFTIVPVFMKLGKIFTDSKTMGFLSLFQAGIEIYAMYLLYSDAGRKWFKGK